MAAKINTVTFEDALDLTGFGKFNFLAILVNISVISGMCMEIMSVSYLVPASACELNTTVSQQGLMAGMPLMGIIATSHIWGYLADTRGRRKILAWCMTLGFCASALATFSPNWIVFSCLKFLSSCAVAGTYALSLTLLSECTPQNRRATWVALSSAFFLAASGTMAIISIPVLRIEFEYYIPFLNIYFNSWRILNIVYAIPCAIGAVCVYYSYESPKYFLRIGDEDQALEVLKGIYAINNLKSGDDYQVKAVTLGEFTGEKTSGFWSSLISQTVPLFKPPLLKDTVLLSIMFVIVYFGINPFMVWLPYTVDAVTKSIEMGDANVTFCDMIRSAQNVTISEHHDCSLNEHAMLSVFAINVLLSTLNVFLSSTINYVGRKRTLILIQIVSGFSGLLINVSRIWMLNSALFILFTAGVLNFGFLSTITVDVFPTYVKAMAVCVTLMIGRGSSVLGINVLKTLMVSNCELAFYMFPGLTFCGGLIAFLLPSDVKKKSTS